MEQAPEQNKSPQGAKNFFMYFLTFALLYTVAINFGGIIFDFINKTLPLAGEFGRSSFSNSALRFHLASLIIASPIFLLLSRKVYREALRNEMLRLSGIRRWLTYITLIVAALIVIGDLIALVNNLLGGETTLRFILKALTVLAIAGAIFYYYLNDIKSLKHTAETPTQKLPLSKAYFTASSVLILLVIIIGIFMIESPAVQRLRKQDSARLNNLTELQQGVFNHWNINGSLPEALGDLQLREGVSEDPLTGEPYTYTILSTSTFELCATFETSNKEKNADVGFFGPDWLHDSGRSCFTRNAESVFDKIPLRLPVE